jgi:hypothetical protein
MNEATQTKSLATYLRESEAQSKLRDAKVKAAREIKATPADMAQVRKDLAEWSDAQTLVGNKQRMPLF